MPAIVEHRVVERWTLTCTDEDCPGKSLGRSDDLERVEYLNATDAEYFQQMHNRKYHGRE